MNLAVGDIIGGNSFEVLFLAAADFFYRPGSIYDEFDADNVFVALLAILMTGILLLGMLRRERYGIAGIGFESALVLLALARLGEAFVLDHTSLIYLKLSVSGHLTIFVTRTRGRFWSTAPAPILFWAVVGTQTLATLIAVYGILMPPLGWTTRRWSGATRWCGSWSRTR